MPPPFSTSERAPRVSSTLGAVLGVGLWDLRSGAQGRRLRVCRGGEQDVFVSQGIVEADLGGGALEERHALLDPHRDRCPEVACGDAR